MKKIWSIIAGVMGGIGLWIFIDHISHFKPHDYFFIANPNINKFIGTNVVSRWADLSFFTYHTLIFFSIWSILIFIGFFFKLKKIQSFVCNNTIATFVLTNYIITVLLYTLFELSTGHPTFGYYGPSNGSIHNVGTNIFTHYILFIVCLLLFIFIPRKATNKKLGYVVITVYLLLYFISVKFAGMYAYKIIWYPYPIFDAVELSKMLGLGNISHPISVLILIITNILIFISYWFLFYLISRSIKRKNNNENIK